MLFDGFPYISTRVVGGLYHIILPPAGGPEADLVRLTRQQAQANQLPSCLVLASDRARYFDPEGGSCASHEPPRGGNIIAGDLASAIDCDGSSEELRTRQNRLANMIDQARRRGGHLLGDLTKGGRAATDEEKADLAGSLADGTPRGLSQCTTCGDWKGVCLDPSEQFAGQVMTVHCYCDNHNRCARCNEQLYERRLNANYYNPADRGIWHVPGFCGLSHRCASGVTATDPRANGIGGHHKQAPALGKAMIATIRRPGAVLNTVQKRDKLVLPLFIDTHAFVVTNSGIVFDANKELVAEFGTIDEAEMFVANANGVDVATLRREMEERHRMQNEYLRNLRQGKKPAGLVTRSAS